MNDRPKDWPTQNKYLGSICFLSALNGSSDVLDYIKYSLMNDRRHAFS